MRFGGGRWQLAEDLEGTLRTLGERGDIIRTVQRELTARNLQRPWLGRSLFGAGETDPEPVVGRVIARGLADEHRNRHYLLVDSVDGHAHYVDIGRGDSVAPIPEGARPLAGGRWQDCDLRALWAAGGEPLGPRLQPQQGVA